MAISAGDAVIELGLDQSALDRGLAGVSSKLDQVSQKWGRTLKIAGGVMVGVAAGVGVAGLKMSSDFDTAWRKVNVMLRASEDEAAEYKKRIKEIAAATGKSATEVTDAFYQIVSAGYRGADSLDILETAVKGAVGGFADAQETTAALTKAMNIFQLEGVGGSSRAMDTFFGIVDTGLLTFEELANAFPRAASNAAGLGIAIEETGAILGTLTKYLGTTEQAATATDAVLRTLISPSEALQDLYAEWGVSSGPEAIAQFGGLTGVLEKLKEATGGEVTAIRELFNSDEAMKGILPLLTSAYNDYNDAILTVTESQGKAADAFEEAAEGPAVKWGQLMTKLQNMAIAIGDALVPALESILKIVTPIIEKVGAWLEKNPMLTATILAVVGGVGGLLLAGGFLLPMISSLISMAPILGAVFAAMTGPIGLVIAGIVGLIAAGVLIWKNWDTIKEKAAEIWNGIVSFFRVIWDSITILFQEHWDKILAILFPPIGIPILIARNWEKIKDALVAPFRVAAKGIESAINWIIRQLNRISFEVPDWVPVWGGKKFGFNIPEISLPTFKEGAMLMEPTLLYGLRSGRPLGIAGEAGPEPIGPTLQPTTTVNNYFQGPWFIREEADIDKIARRLFQLQRTKSLQAGIA